MEIHRSARRHGVADADIDWATEHLVAIERVGHVDSPHRWLLLGTDRSGRVLELIVMVFQDGREMVIHAMPIRSKFKRLLPTEDS